MSHLPFCLDIIAITNEIASSRKWGQNRRYYNCIKAKSIPYLQTVVLDSISFCPSVAGRKEVIYFSPRPNVATPFLLHVQYIPFSWPKEEAKKSPCLQLKAKLMGSSSSPSFSKQLQSLMEPSNLAQTIFVKCSSLPPPQLSMAKK